MHTRANQSKQTKNGRFQSRRGEPRPRIAYPDNTPAANIAEFVSLLQNTSADTLGDILPIARRTAGPGVPVKYHAEKGPLSTSALLIISSIPDYKFVAPLASARGTVISWDAGAVPTTRVVSYPPPALAENASITEVVKNLDSWTITPMRDDTVITLYYHDGSWKLSSARGIDVSNHCWMDTGITFLEALNECLKEFSWENLDKEWCYTVGFHHHKMHPFTADPQRATLLQAARMDKLTPYVVSCAPATRDEFNTIAANLHLEADAPVELPELSAKKLKSWLLLNNKHALNNYVQTIYRGNVNVPIHYGYILRRVSGEDGSGPSNISLASSLFQLIKQSVYSFPQDANLTADNRRRYVVLRACLTPGMKHDFLRLFPQWSEDYNNYERSINGIALSIVAELSQRQLGAADTEESPTSALINTLINLINPFGVNPLDAQAISIVTDIITAPTNLDLLMEYIS